MSCALDCKASWRAEDSTCKRFVSRLKTAPGKKNLRGRIVSFSRYRERERSRQKTVRMNAIETELTSEGGGAIHLSWFNDQILRFDWLDGTDFGACGATLSGRLWCPLHATHIVSLSGLKPNKLDKQAFNLLDCLLTEGAHLFSLFPVSDQIHPFSSHMNCW